jgi:hypothetical protein
VVFWGVEDDSHFLAALLGIGRFVVLCYMASYAGRGRISWKCTMFKSFVYVYVREFARKTDQNGIFNSQNDIG